MSGSSCTFCFETTQSKFFFRSGAIEFNLAKFPKNVFHLSPCLIISNVSRVAPSQEIFKNPKVSEKNGQISSGTKDKFVFVPILTPYFLKHLIFCSIEWQRNGSPSPFSIIVSQYGRIGSIFSITERSISLHPRFPK